MPLPQNSTTKSTQEFAQVFIGYFVTLFVAIALIHAPTPALAKFDQAAASATLLRIDFFYRADRDVADLSHLGFVVGTDKVLTSAVASSGAQRIVVVTPGGDKLEAVAEAISGAPRFALLSVAGLNASIPALTLDSVDSGQPIHVSRAQVRIAGGIFGRGTSGEANIAGAPNVFQYQPHGAVRDLGGPIYDNCGSIVGMTVPMPDASRRDLRRGQGLPTTVSLAANGSSMRGFLISTGIPVGDAATPCPTGPNDAEEIARLEAEADAARIRAEELEQRAKALESAAAASSEEKAAAKEAAEAARADAEEAAARAKALEEEMLATEDELIEAEQSLEEREKELSDAAAKSEQLQLWLILLFAAGTIIAIVAAIFIIRAISRRNTAVAAARVAALQAEEEAEQLRAIPKAVAPFADCLLESTDTDARNIVLPGALLPLQAGGVTVGRNPQHAAAILDDERVSRRHVTFWAEDNDIFCKDLGSANGTEIDGERLVPNMTRAVSDGARIVIAQFSFRLRVLK